MRPFIPVILALSAPLFAGAQEASGQTNQAIAALAGWEKLVGPSEEVICKPAYYRRFTDDCLVSAAAAAREKDLRVNGVVLEIVEPRNFLGQVVAFHFDFPEQWDHWYKPDLLYTGVIRTAFIGRLAFMCDPGWRVVTNGVARTPNPQSGADGRQPSGSESSRKPAAAASRRSL